MNRLGSVVCLLLLALVLAGARGGVAMAAGRAAAAMPGPVLTVRRFAVVVGANDGGSDRVVLRYAASDAAAVGSVLERFGGVAASDMVSLVDPSPAQLFEAIEQVSQRIRAARRGGQHVQLVFYYSGHSDEEGLLLAGERLRYRELRERVQAVPADVRIAVLDSCASGAFTRQKGGTKRAPFLVSPAAEVKGHAFLTSSSVDEAAQESDRVGGSFFTHYFTTGLRGAADVDGDRLITLSEAYQFAFEETLARTEATRGGAQHAAYDIQLAGSGDLVMTDLRETSARLELAQDVGGRISVRSVSSRGPGQLAAELYKPVGGAPVILALEPGRYQITVDDGTALWRAELTVADGGRAVLEPAALARVQPESTVRRGDEPGAAPTGADDEYQEIPFDIGLWPSLSINGQDRSGKKIRNRIGVSGVWGRAARVDGVSGSFGVSVVDEHLEGAQLSLVGNVAGEAEGLQLAGVFDHATQIRGVQAAMVNHAKEVVPGAQLGVVNTAGFVRGAQLGIVNVGREVRGAQVGFFNFSRSADAAVGLLSITREGGVHPEISSGDTADIQVGLRFPARRTYSMLAVEVEPSRTNGGWAAGLGFGGRFWLPKKLFFDLDLVVLASFRGFDGVRSPAALGKLRLTFGWQAFERLALFGGPTLDALVELDTVDVLPRPGFYQASMLDYTSLTDRFRVRVWPGFVAGLRF
ncbi:caspase family protein [Paraliomyxa miuraensis]|uniref:caspase family protein n=1 Tax=Paraliomyxa miuraensis TaxID=376150 RepID=UPI0022550276|nr:caspase family protein [Paraliomyxa miuraensis]MCX4246551.1 caspase family protein [Paraliomyxa miuraensis]